MDSYMIITLAALLISACAKKIERNYYPDRSQELKDGDTFQNIVVGGGTAGCTLAYLLNILTDESVLLVEQGAYNPPSESIIPGTFFKLYTSPEYVTRYETITDDKTCLLMKDNMCRWSGGKMLGGTSEVNAFFWARGSQSRYDDWGLSEWNSSIIELLYKNLEDYVGIEYLPDEDTDYNGSDGLVTLGHFQPSGVDELREKIIDSYKDCGITYNADVNGKSRVGVTNITCTTYGGERYGAADNFLNNEKPLKNIFVALNSVVTKIIIEDNYAKGIKVKINGTDEISCYSDKVILTSGVLHTPQILMNSGIGPKKHLESLNIKVKADLPVGENLQDVAASLIFFTANTNKSLPVSPNIYKTYEKMWYNNRSGPMASFGIGDIMTFISTDDGIEPNAMIMHFWINRNDTTTLDGLFKSFYLFNDDAYNKIAKANTESDILMYILHHTCPKTRGELKLSGANMADPLIIEPNYFAKHEDLENMLYQLRLIQETHKSTALESFGLEYLDVLDSVCNDYTFDSDEYWKCLMPAICSGSGDTYVGTASMGQVTDESLRVTGFSNLYVADASVIPSLVGGSSMPLATVVAAKLALDLSD